MFTDLHLAPRGVISSAPTPPNLPAPAPLSGREAVVELRSKPFVCGDGQRRATGKIRPFTVYEPVRVEEVA